MINCHRYLWFLKSSRDLVLHRNVRLRLELRGWRALVAESQRDVAFIDSSGLCLFPGGCGWTMDDYKELVNAACQGDWDSQETGERIWNLEKLFNLKAGLGKKDDTLPKRILTEPADVGTGKGLVCKLDEMLPEYYQLNGWDEEGVPRPETLARLNLN